MTEPGNEGVSIITALARGDPDAAESFLSHYGDLLWAMAGRAAPSTEEREDVAGRLFAAVAREAWGYRTAVGDERLLVALIARRQLRAQPSDGDGGKEPGIGQLEEPLHESPDAPGRVAAGALGELDVADRRSVILAVAYALPPSSVAAITGLDESRIVASVRDALARIAGDAPGASADASRQRLRDLMADAVWRPLDDGELAELETLQSEVTDIDNELMERSAASVVLALGEGEGLPAMVRDRLIVQWRRWSGVNSSRSDAKGGQGAHGGDGSHWLAAWWLAAAGFVLAVLGWWPTLSQWLDGGEGTSEQLADFRASASDVLRAEWQPGDALDRERVSGELLWSTDNQRGYMVLDNVPSNDPDQAQYQLWIFDDERAEYPVNGGVFNVPANKDSTVVPITPEVAVDDPSFFAVTREPPGGVVVSDQERIVLTAKPKGSEE